MDSSNNLYRRLPQIQRLLEMPDAGALCQQYGRGAVVAALRETLAELRRQIRAGDIRQVPEREALLAASADNLRGRSRGGLRPVINATGIVLHTNLGRAPLAAEVIAAAASVAGGYCNLEYDLESGGRGSRTHHIEPLLQSLTGAEAGLAVNNGAAALLLALSALSGGGEVIVSRGELVEIGGGFRIPEVIRQGGARLVEVGATNKTRIEDYRNAIGPDSRVLLKVHQSNFRLVGFTGETAIGELSALAREHGLTLVADLGSGQLQDSMGVGEPTLRDALSAGADLVTCSGDKLLGGPQAGLVVGRRTAVEPLRRHPLLRALRLDKMTLAALEATLILHRDQPDRLPVVAMLRQNEAVLRRRAECLTALLGAGRIESSTAFAGGGSLPEEKIASQALVLEPAMGAGTAAAILRTLKPAVVGRVRDGRLVLDMLTVTDDQVPALARALEQVL